MPGPVLWLAGIVLIAILFRTPTPDRGLWGRAYLANLPMPTYAAWEGEWQGTGHLPGRDFPEPKPASPAGLGAYLDTGVTQAHVPRALKELERWPTRWARTEIPWAGVEPQPGRWEWSRWDKVVDGLHVRQYRVLGMLCYWTGGIEPYSDAAIAAFGRYAEAVARRYQGKVDHWEVWNEPNSTFWSSTPERYVQLLRAAYEGVKRGNPQAMVIGASLSGVDLFYLRNLFRLGAAQWMDALSVHPYTFGWPPESTRLIQELRGAAAAMHAAGKSPGLWLTEIGVSSWNERKAADWSERTIILAAQSRAVEAWFWFCFYLPYPSAYSLHRPDWTPRPVAARLKGLIQRIDGAQPVGSGLPGDLTAPWGAGHPAALTGAQIWCFRGPKQIETAGWVSGNSLRLSPTVSGATGPAVLHESPVWWSLPDGSSRRE